MTHARVTVDQVAKSSRGTVDGCELHFAPKKPWNDRIPL